MDMVHWDGHDKGTSSRLFLLLCWNKNCSECTHTELCTITRNKKKTDVMRVCEVLLDASTVYDVLLQPERLVTLSTYLA